MKLRNKEG